MGGICEHGEGGREGRTCRGGARPDQDAGRERDVRRAVRHPDPRPGAWSLTRSEEHTSELQSRLHLVCRLLLEKKKKTEETQHTSPKAIRRECRPEAQAR